MPAGDAQRTWFPEMLDVLRARWRQDMPFEELIELAGELDAMLHQIRSDRNVHKPVIRCPYCGQVGPAAEPDVSVRATILSLGRFGIAPAGPVKALEKAWAAHRKRNGLDLYGKRADRAEADAPTCGHADGR